MQDHPVYLPKGKLFSDIPADYLQWLPGTGLDKDMACTVRYHLGEAAND
jgi:hypothetical protein